ncbi:hypothetical protein O1611_g1434 [Lasiodiplodia mahajangana]|uniref:Uncharacterized protein n=1 Tax=Lasiodiplodia mahajangana TaxID=1108764 RepID=A0ACC2JXL5_9PEZI|nr:hypothetical protein O1611_g1434 [Lasiodiplodia mahajangana]
MCWSKVGFKFCYECSREFEHKARIIPCRASESGEPCALNHVDDYVVEVGENCDECKASRKAEEECQRAIYRSRPLCLDVKGKDRMAALFAAYHYDLATRKKLRREHLARRAEFRQRFNDDEDEVEEEEPKQEGVVIAPMFITIRHQYKTSYTRGEPTCGVVMRSS